MRLARCGGANSTPSREAIPRPFAMTTKALHRLGGGRGPALPVVPRVPRGHRAQPVGAVAQRDGARVAVQQAALGAGGVDHVDGLGPAVEGGVDVGDGAGAQERGEGPSRAAPGASPSLTPSTYASTRAEVSGSREE